MNLNELLDAVKEENLTKMQLEKYRDDLVHVHTKMKWEMADLQKKEARFIYAKPQDLPDIKHKREWKASPDGQRQIEIKNWMEGVVKEIDSLKSRLFNLY